MGSADIVPGVSGGTVALVLGIYERLVAAIHTASSVLASLVRGDPSEAGRRLRTVPWLWVFSLLAGIALAIVLLASVLEGLLEDHPELMAALFLGLILGAVVVSWRLVRQVTWPTIAVMLVSALVFFLFLGLRESTAAQTADAADHPWWALFLAGAVAICAMILPGISGSFILVLLGMYTVVLGAVNDRTLTVLAIFALGCVVGLASFASVLTWLLEHYHDLVLAAMIGLMLGSVRVLWPWPDGLESTSLALPSGDPVLLPALLALGGFAVVIGIELVSAFSSHRDRDQQTQPAPR